MSGVDGQARYHRPEPARSGGLLAGIFLLVLGTSLLGVILPIRGHERGSGMLTIGLFSAAWSGGFVAATIACGSLLSRFGHRHTFLGLAMLSGLLAVLFPLVPRDGAWIAFRFASGFGFGGAAAIVEAWLLEASPGEGSFARYMITTLVASLTGTLSLNLVRPEGLTPFLIASGALLLSLVPILCGSVAAPSRPALFTPRVGLFARRSPLAATGCLLTGLMTGAFGGLGPVFGMMAGLDMRGDTIMLAANAIGGALGCAPVTVLSRRYGRRAAIAACAGLGMLVCLPLAVFGTGLGASWLIASLFMAGFAQYPIYGLSVGLAGAEAPDRPVPAVSSEGILVFGLGTIIGPIACGQLLRVGTAALPILLCFGFALLVAGSIRRALFPPDPEKSCLTGAAPS